MQPHRTRPARRPASRSAAAAWEGIPDVNSRRIAAGALAALLALWSLAGAAAGASGSPRAAVPADVSPTPTDVATPTVAVTPTDSPVPPTDSPSPAETATDAATPTADATPTDGATPGQSADASAISSVAPTAIVPSRVYSRGYGGKTIALTFDDGYNSSNCRLILNTLRSQHVPATFFPYIYAASKDPSFWRTVAADGYPIGNHTTSHPHLTTLPYANQVWELENARYRMEQMSGVSMLNVFRPPYRDYNSTTLLAAGEAGLPITLLWDVDSRDDATTYVADVVTAATGGRSGSVVLFHCGPAVTVYALPYVIDYYRKQGYTFVNVADMFGMAWGGPPVSYNPGPIPPIPTMPPGMRVTDAPDSSASAPAPDPTAYPSMAGESGPPGDQPSPSPSPSPSPAVETPYLPAAPKPVGGDPTDIIVTAMVGVLLAGAAGGSLLAHRRGLWPRRPPGTVPGPE
jgi:peptidoglycan/xylan/chitin deacetylase (PgdA/CDA1 family)